MIAFISSTPHQTWDAIVMAKKLFPDKECDLFILDHCDNYKRIAELVKKENIFTDVYTCDVLGIFCRDIKNSVIRKLKRVGFFVFWRRYLRKHAPVNKG